MQRGMVILQAIMDIVMFEMPVHALNAPRALGQHLQQVAHNTYYVAYV